MKYRRVKGTKDTLPAEAYQWQYLEKFIAGKLEKNNYQEIRTPMFEITELFARSIGAETDVVSKEMYSFNDKGGHNLTLRPELTAPVIRAYIQNHLEQIAPVIKLYYLGPLFRQERPQKGRLRQFNQFGFEIIGSPHPEADAEVIQTTYDLYRQLGIKELTIKLNSIGSRSSRQNYLQSLANSLRPHLADFCSTCQKRFHKNILRLFDCKSENCQKLLDQHAPSILDYLDDEDRNHFQTVKRLLDLSRTPYEIDNKLVRGLDYYTRTTFEITHPLLGAQDALCGGGRYDHLVEELGGNPTPAVGVASGMERLLLVLEKSHALPEPEIELLYIATIGDNARAKGFQLLTAVRQRNITADMDFLRRSLKAQLRDASKKNARWVVIIGGDELEKGVVVLKNMRSGDQQEINFDEAATIIQQKIAA